jgi:hypothetical protein
MPCGHCSSQIGYPERHQAVRGPVKRRTERRPSAACTTPNCFALPLIWGILNRRENLDNEMLLEGVWLALLIVLVVVVWVLSKVFYYARKSEQQWRDVDPRKLKGWVDDD